MSRSNVTEGSRNPASRWFEWAGGGDQGHIRYYDKDKKENVTVALPFRFLLLDELATVKGWHEQSLSGIYANEVRDTRAETLLVRSFKGGELATGFYKANRDRIAALGGYFQASCYIAYKDGDALKIGNLGINGAALAAWSEFKKNCPVKKDATGKTVKAYFVDAVCIDGFKDGQKGRVKFRTPTFKTVEVTPETNEAALALDRELQQFMADYFSRTRTEQTAKPAAAHVEQEPEHEAPPVAAYAGDGFEDQDVPF